MLPEMKISQTASEALKCKKGACMSFLALLYKHRRLCMHAVVEHSLASLLFGQVDTRRQLLVLGCGLDTSYEESFAERRGVRVFHVDLPEVVSLGTNKQAISADLRHVDSLHEKLSKAGFCFSTHTVVLTEMVLNYLPRLAVQSLLSFLSSALHGHALFVSYDFVLPEKSSGLLLLRLSWIISPRKGASFVRARG